MNQKMQKVVAAIFMALVSVSAFAKYGYVTDGLIAHWDAIDNNAVGQTVRTSTDWVDLVAGYTIPTGRLPMQTASGDYEVGIAFPAKVSVAQLLPAEAVQSSQLTIEVVCRAETVVDGSENAIVALPMRARISYEPRTGGNIEGGNAAFVYPSKTTSFGYLRNTILQNEVSKTGDETKSYHTYSLIAGKGSGSGYYDGDGTVLREPYYTADAAGTPDGTLTLGSANGQKMIRSIRIYNRALTPEQVAQNRAIDAERFDNAVLVNSMGYASEGLVAHWDAIDNAATGVHDKDATGWKDLVGGLVIAGIEGKFKVNAKDIAFSDTHVFNGLSVADWKKPLTIEVYTMARGVPTSSGATTMFRLDNRGGINFDGRFAPDSSSGGGFVVLYPPNANFTGNLTCKCVDTKIPVAETARNFHTYTLVPKGGSATAYYDGVGYPVGTRMDWTDSGSTPPSGSGRIGSAVSMPQVRSIRIYNRELTASEVATNRLADVERFENTVILTEEGYVADGLVAHWDAIDNTGTGSHVESATWVDRVGGLTLDVTGLSFANNGYVVTAPIPFSGLTVENWKSPVTMEINCCEDATVGYDVHSTVFMVDARGGISFDNRFPIGNFVSIWPSSSTYNPKVYHDVGNSATDADRKSAFHTYSVVARMSNSGTAFYDGRACSPIGVGMNWYDGTAAVATPPGTGFVGASEIPQTVRSIRIYNRELTAKEAAINAETDRVRLQFGETVWTNSTGGAWTTAENWSAGVPTVEKSATIGQDMDADYSVSVTGSAAVNGLLVRNRTAGVTVDVGADARLALSADSPLELGTNATLAVSGTLVHAGATGSAALQNDFLTLGAGSRLLVDDGAVAFSNVLSRVSVKKGAAVELTGGRLDVVAKSGVSFPIVNFGGKLKATGGVVNFATKVDGYDGRVFSGLPGAEVDLSGDAELRFEYGTFSISDGTWRFRDTSALVSTAQYGLKGIDITPDAEGGTTTVSFEDSSAFNKGGRLWQSVVNLGKTPGGRAILNYATTASSTVPATFNIGSAGGYGEFNLSAGRFATYKYNQQIRIGFGGTDASRTSTGVVNVSGGVLDILGGSHHGFEGLCIGYGLVAGSGDGASEAISISGEATAGKAYGELNVTGGSISNGTEYASVVNIILGAGNGEGVVNQTGGEIVDCANAVSCPVVLGLFGGKGRWTMSGGSAKILNPAVTTYIGGLSTNVLQSYVLTANNRYPYPMAVAGRHDAVGSLEINGGTFETAGGVVLSHDGTGTISMGADSNARLSAASLTVANPSTLSFKVGPNGCGQIAVSGKFVLAAGSKLVVDATDCPADAVRRMPLLTFGSFEGTPFADADITVIGLPDAKVSCRSTGVYFKPRQQGLILVVK